LALPHRLLFGFHFPLFKKNRWLTHCSWDAPDW
jgi:hypothetical protein